VAEIQYIIWKDFNSVGVSELDRHHQLLIGLINQLYNTIHSDPSGDQSHNLIHDLQEYAKMHFLREENIFADTDYPDMTIHKRAHQKYVMTFRELLRDPFAGPMTVSYETLQFLKEWWLKHINQMDKGYAPFVKKDL
jgi:hemerythrin